MEEPRERLVHLLAEAERDQGVEREGGVAYPRVAVVVVAVAADALRERGRRRGGDRARRRVHEQPEGERAAGDGVDPRPVVAPAAEPAVPGLARGVDAAVDLDELHAESLYRSERHGAAAETVDEQRRAHRLHLAREELGRLQARERVALIDLEKQTRGRDLIGRELRRHETPEFRVFDRLAGQVHGEARYARALREALDGVAHHPAVEVRHHAEVLEHRKELPRRKQGPLFLAQPNEHLGHRIALVAGKLQDRLAIELELVVLDGAAQPLDRVRPAGQLGVHPLEEGVVHRRILAMHPAPPSRAQNDK